jgi:hypothetical protein
MGLLDLQRAIPVSPNNRTTLKVLTVVTVKAVHKSRVVRDSTFYTCAHCGNDSIVHETNMPSGRDYFSGECPMCDIPLNWDIN